MASLIHHPWRIPDELAARYPSHLHIDLLPPPAGQRAWQPADQDTDHGPAPPGIPGVHLHVPRANQHAAGFYRHLGFTELPATGAELPAPHLHLFAMDLRTAS